MTGALLRTTSVRGSGQRHGRAAREMPRTPRFLLLWSERFRLVGLGGGPAKEHDGERDERHHARGDPHDDSRELLIGEGTQVEQRRYGPVPGVERLVGGGHEGGDDG